MPDSFQSLVAAILDNDRRRVKQLLAQNAALATAGAAKAVYDAGGDATLRNQPGSTPFHLAVQTTGRGGSGADQAKAAQREIIQTFLERGISPRLKDARGKSVLEWAKSDWIRQMLKGNCE